MFHIDGKAVGCMDSLNKMTSKEKHSLTRKLVGYRNWRPMVVLKGREQGFEKRVMRQKSYI